MDFEIKLSGDDLNAILAALKGNTERIMGSLTQQAQAQANPPTDTTPEASPQE